MPQKSNNLLVNTWPIRKEGSGNSNVAPKRQRKRELMCKLAPG